jgi:hypothetical protein
MAVLKIKVPKTPKSAFNKYRPASDLLKAQLEHLEAAAGKYPDERPTGRRAVKVLTEEDVATRIHALTRARHPVVGDEQPAPAAPVEQVRQSRGAVRTATRRRRPVKKSTLRKGGHKARKKG